MASGVTHRDLPSPSAPYRDTHPPPRCMYMYDTNPRTLHCLLHHASLPWAGCRPSAMTQHGIGFSVADILDPANFYGSSGSSEKDADREPAAAAFRLQINSYLLHPLPLKFLEVS